MNIQTLNQTIKTLEGVRNAVGSFTRADVDLTLGLLRREVEALAEKPAPVQEPVAWRTFDGEGGYDYRTYDMNESYAKEWNERNPNHKGWVEPLYTTPPAAQRQWVGLTKEEFDEIHENNFTLPDAMVDTIAKLKEKNT